MSRGHGRLEVALLAFLRGKRRHWSTAALTTLAVDDQEITFARNSVLRALSRLELEGLVRRAAPLTKRGSSRWSAEELRQPVKRRPKRLLPARPLGYKPSGLPTRRSNDPRQCELELRGGRYGTGPLRDYLLIWTNKPIPDLHPAKGEQCVSPAPSKWSGITCKASRATGRSHD